MSDPERVRGLAELRGRLEDSLEGDLPRWVPKPLRPVWWGGRELCAGIGELVDDNRLWGDFERTAGELDQDHEYRRLVNEIEELLSVEDQTLQRLGVDPDERNRVILDAQRAVRIIEEPAGVSRDRVQNLRARVGEARSLICRESRFRIRRKHFVSGGLIASGATIAAANVIVELNLPSGQALASLDLGLKVIEGGVGAFLGEIGTSR